MGTAKVLAHIRIIKNIDKMRTSVEKTLDDFHDTAGYLKQYKWKIVKSCLLTLLQWLMFFIIPYCLYNAFGLGMLSGQPGALGTVSPLDEAVSIVAMAAFLFLAVHFIPIPGSSGATEAGFGIFFGSFFFVQSAAAMFIWRLITYYSMIVIGFVLACTTLFLAITTVVNANTQTITMMRVFGYSLRECSGAILNGYRPVSYIGFAVGTVYQYALLKIMLSLFSKGVENIPEYHFDVKSFIVVLISFALIYEVIMACYSARIKKISVKEIMLK
jgi:hypothetical protein